MDKHITPEPHHLPGYDGHISNYKYYIGGTYGLLTNRALLDCHIPHSQDLNLTVIPKSGGTNVSTAKERNTLHRREQFIDAVYRNPMMPGYRGFVPKMKDQIGKPFFVAAETALSEYEALMEVRRCELRNLQHGDILSNSVGVFESHLGERMMPKSKYRAPLLEVNKKCQGVSVSSNCILREKKVPYTKYEVPHFKENDDEDKWIIKGYCGHIPRISFLYGKSNKLLTNVALNEFSDIRRGQLHDMCKMDKMQPGVPKDMTTDCDVYHKHSNVIPLYGGHVPGRKFQCGTRFAIESTNVKGWLNIQKHNALQIPSPRCGEQCR